MKRCAIAAAATALSVSGHRETRKNTECWSLLFCAVLWSSVFFCGVFATTKINRRDFNLQYNRLVEAVPVVGDEIQVQIDIEATKR